MARLPRFRGPLIRRITLLLLLAVPPILLDRGSELVVESLPQLSQQGDDENTTSSLGLAAPRKAGKEFEDDADDVLPHHFMIDWARAGHEPAQTLDPLLSSLSTERPLRPPIG